ALIGVVGAFGVWFIGYRNLLKMSRPLLIGATFLLLLVFLPGVGLQINGAHRWINLFGNSFQPSEFVKFLIPLFYIQRLLEAKEEISLKRFLQILLQMSIPMGLILIEPDNGTVAIIITTLVALFILTRLKWVYWALPLLLLCICGGIIASRMPHVSDRIRIYLHPEEDLRGKGHQPYQAKIAAGSGKLWGKGIGESLQKLEYLPEARSDYIAAIFAEECGFIGIIGLIFLYMLIGFCGFHIAFRAQDVEGFYVAAIFTFLICLQAFLNLGVVSGLLPSKGTNLPFFSQGGSSLISHIMGVCVILNVAKRLNPVRVLK
ncbi:MAG: cell division protein FtsW, partial [Chlamydiales bacterium]|nr:cell division protein FtsW [Chlamydiales bacterium]